VGDEKNYYHPFKSNLEWEIAKWAKLQGPSSNAFDQLIQIDGVIDKLGLSFKSSSELNQRIDENLPGCPHFARKEICIGNETCDVYFQDIIDCVKALLEDPNFAPYLVFEPEKHYTDDTETTRMYHDMHTGRWWWEKQKELETKTPGSTIVPIIISTDKTQLTLFQNKTAYPVYLTISNIPKEIRQKPSARAYVLLGYSPTTCLEGVTNKSSQWHMLANLYHACMSTILKPLETLGDKGFHMTTADGCLRCMHPLFAVFIGDYPEQILTTCVCYGDCPTCSAVKPELEDFDSDVSSSYHDLDAILDVLDSFDVNTAAFLQTCQESQVKPVIDSFWKNLPHVNIYESISPDVLHQLHQGIIKHLVAWVVKAFGETEINAHCHRLPPNHNIRLFTKGITSLSRVTGQEHDQIARILLGLIIDIPLPHGISSARLVCCVRALLDFLYLAQYPIHTDKTLILLEQSLQSFHENRDIFIELKIRQDYNLPKLHFAEHYVKKIKLFGTTYNYNTKFTEQLHIDLAKEAYRASNHKDEFKQMTRWLERKIYRHEQYIAWCISGKPVPKVYEWQPPGLELNRTIHLSKFPSARKVSLNALEIEYGAIDFRNAFAKYVLKCNHPDMLPSMIKKELWGVHMPLKNYWVWHHIKYQQIGQYTSNTLVSDSIHAHSISHNKTMSYIPGQFDTALILKESISNTEGFKVGCVCIIFSLPPKLWSQTFHNGSDNPEHLAYVEWFSDIPDEPHPSHLMYKISPKKDKDGDRLGEIIPVERIQRSVHLFPKFGAFAPVQWTSSTVLDLCDTFFINSFTDKHMYRIFV
ncbi:hypothetical protein BDQ17DRAFT_1259683, partial [Cyathus striatus]